MLPQASDLMGVSVSRSRFSAFTVIAAIGCFLVAGGASASGTSLGHFGNAVVQGSLNYEAPVNVCAPEYAIVARTTTVVAAFFLTALLFLPEYISRSRGAVFATAIRPPPVA